MEHELYNKTDKQLLKSNKVDLVAYIRKLEGTLATYVNNAVEPLDSEGNVYDSTQPSITEPTPQHLTSYTFSDTVTKKDMYSF